jgi:peptide/nickel transport system ATP-binding protein
MLELRDIQAAYASRGRTTVVTRGISFTLEDTDCVALVGESGSGKTTIARVIAGLHPTFTGKLFLEGELLAHAAHGRTLEQRRRIQIVFQNPAEALNPKQSVLSTIARPARLLRGMGRAAAAAETLELLEAVRLPSSIAERFPAELSGGEAQRVAIARALAARPDLLVCDEVTSALDVSVQAVVLELLTELRERLRLSVLFITHDLGVVGAVAERVLVLEGGLICEDGEVGKVLREPQHSYTQTLINAAPSLTASVESWEAADKSGSSVLTPVRPGEAEEAYLFTNAKLAGEEK